MSMQFRKDYPALIILAKYTLPIFNDLTVSTALVELINCMYDKERGRLIASTKLTTF